MTLCITHTHTHTLLPSNFQLDLCLHALSIKVVAIWWNILCSFIFLSTFSWRFLSSIYWAAHTQSLVFIRCLADLEELLFDTSCGKWILKCASFNLKVCQLNETEACWMTERHEKRNMRRQGKWPMREESRRKSSRQHIYTYQYWAEP